MNDIGYRTGFNETIIETPINQHGLQICPGQLKFKFKMASDHPQSSPDPPPGLL